MRILYALNSSQPGGMEQHVLDLVEGMTGFGHEVFVCCPNGVVSDTYKKAGAYVVNMEVKSDFDLRYIFALAKFLRDKKIQVVHAHELKTVTNAVLSAFFAGVGVRVAHTHTPISEWRVQQFMKTPAYIGYALLVNFFTTCEIALTRSRKQVKIKEGMFANKIVVIPNGVRVANFILSDGERLENKRRVRASYRIPEDAFVFGMTGRMTVEKGHLSLIDGFAEFLKSFNVERTKVGLFLAGGGELEELIKRKIEGIGFPCAVAVSGIFPAGEKLAILSAFDVFVFPSLSEGFGIGLVEAMAFGLPIVCSDLDVLKEVAGSTVVYFEAGNSRNLAEKLYGIYERRDNLANLSFSARERVRELFSFEKFAQNYNSLYSKLVESNR